MIWFPASWVGYEKLGSSVVKAGGRHQLLSYAHMMDSPRLLHLYHRYGKRPRKIDYPVTPHKTTIWVDSGAFSRWNSGKHIELNDYVAFVKDNHSVIEHHFVLDVIAGRKGRPRTSLTQVEACAEQSYANYCTMRKAGLEPIGIFHQQERRKWLQLYLDHGPGFIAISSYKSLAFKEQATWVERIWGWLVRNGFHPALRVHGLGVNSHKIMTTYPWHSVDGTSWGKSASRGTIYVPRYDGSPDFRRPPKQLIVSNRNAKSWKRWPVPREEVAAYLERELGTDIATLRRSGRERYYVNASYFLRLVQFINAEHNW